MWAYCPHCRHVQSFIIHCQWLKINVDFRGESVLWSQTPSPLAYAVYAFINVDNCERPLKIINTTVVWQHVSWSLLRYISCMKWKLPDSIAVVVPVWTHAAQPKHSLCLYPSTRRHHSLLYLTDEVLGEWVTDTTRWAVLNQTRVRVRSRIGCSTIIGMCVLLYIFARLIGCKFICSSAVS